MNTTIEIISQVKSLITCSLAISTHTKENNPREKLLSLSRLRFRSGRHHHFVSAWKKQSLSTHQNKETCPNSHVNTWFDYSHEKSAILLCRCFTPTNHILALVTHTRHTHPRAGRKKEKKETKKPTDEKIRWNNNESLDTRIFVCLFVCLFAFGYSYTHIFGERFSFIYFPFCNSKEKSYDSPLHIRIVCREIYGQISNRLLKVISPFASLSLFPAFFSLSLSLSSAQR